MLKCFEFQVCDTVIIHVLDSGTYQLKSIRVSEEYMIVLRKKKIVVLSTVDISYQQIKASLSFLSLYHVFLR